MSDDLTGRTYLVTGANTGIGRATAHDLARRGGRVILACRSEARTAPVIEAIRADTGNDALSFLPLDLADLASVRAAAATLLERGDPVHVLVANAGLAGQRGQTAQGFELAFGTNHLGHFLFVTGVLDRLRSTAADAGTPSRVVVVSSRSHYDAKGIPFDDLRRPTHSVTGLPEYAVSKLANVLFAQELARRVPAEEVAVLSLHPGVIASDVWRRVPWPVRPIMTRFMRSTEEGAATSLHCATAPGIEDRSGTYWDECAEREPSAVATPELATELWARSEAWASEP
jgi:NAD(P)-dependent dehydrogenase (short-subunit alcohol dehydrogenase family)